MEGFTEGNTLQAKRAAFGASMVIPLMDIGAMAEMKAVSFVIGAINS